LRGEGRRAAPGEGDSPRIRLAESPAHPNPLPASGARGLIAAAARSSQFIFTLTHRRRRPAAHETRFRMKAWLETGLTGVHISARHCEPTGRANARSIERSNPSPLQKEKLDCLVARAPRQKLTGQTLNLRDFLERLKPKRAPTRGAPTSYRYSCRRDPCGNAQVFRTAPTVAECKPCGSGVRADLVLFARNR
jgi:hypothetical protein